MPIHNEQLTPIVHTGDSRIDKVCSRIHYKMRDYAAYKFSSQQSCAINIFFDLAQEFEEVEEIQVLCVQILHMFFSLPAELHMKSSEDGAFYPGTPLIDPAVTTLPTVRAEIWRQNRRCYIPMRGRDALLMGHSSLLDEDIMGVLVLESAAPFEEHERLFLEKFVNRVGFCLHNKLLAQRNSQHILFLRKLAHDIGHNIITPNMRLMLMLNQMEGQLASFAEFLEAPQDDASQHDLRILHRKMTEQARQISSNFKNSAIFLESLLRQSHFDLGHYVLRRSRLDICSLVVLPQFERFRTHFEECGIAALPEHPQCPPTPCMVQADFGLISQVLANLLSNAGKYARPAAEDEQPEVRCWSEVEDNAFGAGRDGIKVAVFSTGTHIPEEEARRLFEDNYRASNSSGQYGTGHGLFFVREIVDAHQGLSGYTPAPRGNVFHFTLPLVE